MYQTLFKIKRWKILLLLFVTILGLRGFTIHPSQAAETCCKCQKASENYCINLSDVGDCASAEVTSPALKQIQTGNEPLFVGFNCSAALTPTQCRTIAQGGVCGSAPLAPTELVNALKAADKQEADSQSSGSSISSGQKTPLPPLTVPELGVKIPGLDFSNIRQVENGSLLIPFLAQYISAGYRYLIGVGVIAAIIMVMYGGFRYMVGSAMGDVKRGKKIILDAVLGLVLILSAYLILQTVNPATLNLDAVRVPLVGQEEADQGDVQEQPQAEPESGPCTESGAGCSDEKTCTALCKDPSLRPKCSPNVADPTLVKVIPNTPGIDNRGSTKFLTDLMPKIKTASEAANAKGYTLMFLTPFSGYRPLIEQWNTACRAINAGKGKRVWGKGNTIAKPGGSNHGRGRAIDINLMRGTTILVPSGDPCIQNNSKYKEPSTELTNIMVGAGWQRLKTEMWHFEYGTPSDGRVCTNNCPQPPDIPRPESCK